MISHALVDAPRAAGRMVTDRWIAVGFAIGSVCFLVGPFPGFLELVGARADAWVFFVGSLFFTAAAGLELLHATADRPHRDATWWSAAIQFAGTLFFNLSTGDVLRSDLSTHQEDRLVASYIVPDTGSILDLAAANWTTALGGLCFLVGAVMLARHHRGVTP